MPSCTRTHAGICTSECVRDPSVHTLYSSGIDITTQTDSNDDEMCALMLGEVLKGGFRV